MEVDRSSREMKMNTKAITWMCSRNITISLALILALVPLITALPHHNVVKRSSFYDLGCKGTYNKSLFFKLERICEDCYLLFREPQVHTQCKAKCFKTEIFAACLDALQLAEEKSDNMYYVEYVGGRK